MSRPASLDTPQLLECAHGALFGPGNARLPAPPMLMFDRITRIDETGGAFGKGQLVAELDIRPDLWFFACHFEGDPVMPGCLGLDAMWQLAGFYLPWLGEPGRGRALGVGEVKFTGQVLPTREARALRDRREAGAARQAADGDRRWPHLRRRPLDLRGRRTCASACSSRRRASDAPRRRHRNGHRLAAGQRRGHASPARCAKAAVACARCPNYAERGLRSQVAGVPRDRSRRRRSIASSSASWAMPPRTRTCRCAMRSPTPA